jgi:hypothetical protein
MMLLSKVVVPLIIVAFNGLLASSAGAAEWHTNGHQLFSTTSAGAARAVVHSPSGPVVIECAAATGTGTLRGPTIAGAVALGITTVTPVIGGPCTVSGVPGFSITCRPAELNALGYSGGTTFATAGGGVTSASITSLDCTVAVASVQCSTMTGSVTAHYINPAPLNSATPSRLTVTGAGQQLTVSKIGAGCAALPNGTATVGKPGAGSTITDITYTIDGPNAPWMFRTP